MGDGCAVSLSVPAGNEAFLRRIVNAARDGLREELKLFGDRLGESKTKLLLEDAAYTVLLDGLDRGRVVCDDELRAAVAWLADAVDRGNEYGRVVFEHKAIHDLRDQLGGEVAR